MAPKSSGMGNTAGHSAILMIDLNKRAVTILANVAAVHPEMEILKNWLLNYRNKSALRYKKPALRGLFNS